MSRYVGICGRCQQRVTLDTDTETVQCPCGTVDIPRDFRQPMVRGCVHAAVERLGIEHTHANHAAVEATYRANRKRLVPLVGTQQLPELLARLHSEAPASLF